MLKKQHFILFILFFLSGRLISQNFVIDSNFEKLEFRNKDNQVQNGFAQLKLLENYSWLEYSPMDIKIYFEHGESKFASINVNESDFVQTQLCCYPTKDLFYEVKVNMRLNQFSKNGISYIKAYILSEPYVQGEEMKLIQELLLTFNPSIDGWQELSSFFKSNGEERYILVGIIGEFRADILVDVNAEGYQNDIVLDLQNISLQLASNQKGAQKASEKVEF